MVLDVPVVPDADTAREWARDELAKDEYRDQGTSWFESFLQWVQDLFSSIGDVGAPLGVNGTWIAVAVTVAIVGLVLWLVLGPMRRSRRAVASGGLFDDDERTSVDMRAAGDAAFDQGDWDLATMEYFRAGVRAMEERGSSADAPGLTAHEAARMLGVEAPSWASALERDATAFDRARYGSGGLQRHHAEAARETCVGMPRGRKAEVDA